MKRTEIKKHVDIVFAHWQKVMDHPTAKLLPVREKAIAARLRESYTVEQINAAIDGCRSSKFHMGDNEQGAVYDDLTLICRNGAKLEFFINLGKKKPRNIDRIATASTDTASTHSVRCRTCGDFGVIDSHPNNPGYVPDRKFTPCPNCNQNKTVLESGR